MHTKKEEKKMLQAIKHLEVLKEREKMEKARRREENKTLQQHPSTLKLKRALKAKDSAIRRLRKKAVREAKEDWTESLLDAVKAKLLPQEFRLLSALLKKGIRRGQAYGSDIKTLAVSLNFRSPKQYKHLVRLFSLPKPQTVKRWLSNFDIKEGFDPLLAELLKEKVQKMPEEDRYCALFIDEISLMERVILDEAHDRLTGIERSKDGHPIYPSNALVFMVGGIKAKYRQAVGYFFSKNIVPGQEVLNLVVQALEYLTNVGLIVTVISSDQGSNFRALFRQLGITEEQRFFLFNGRKIFCMHDPPHLMKSMRNLLLEHSVTANTGEAKWSHIKELHRVSR